MGVEGMEDLVRTFTVVKTWAGMLRRFVSKVSNPSRRRVSVRY